MIGTDTRTLWICQCCVMSAVNADESGCDQLDEHPHGIAGDLTRDTFGGLPPAQHADDCARRSDEESDCSYDCETIGFSSMVCDGCGSRLAGSRYAMTQFVDAS